MGGTVLLADMNAFYASVEIARDPSLRGKPVLVCGDPERRHGIILAASKEAKKFGVKTGMVVGEARAICPGAMCVQPHMQLYMEVSWQIQEIARTISPVVEPYSIDELFIDVRGTEHIWGSSVDAAREFRERVLEQAQVPCSVGVSFNKFMAKMACDQEGKKAPDGIALWKEKDVIAKLHPLPLREMFMVGSRMEQNFKNMGLLTIGDLAHYPVVYLKKRFGIRGDVYHHLAWGRDPSPVMADAFSSMKGVGHQMTLPRDYYRKEDIELVLLELTDLVCQRARKHGKAGRVVSVGCRSYDLIFGFYRQGSLATHSNVPEVVFEKVRVLFLKHWDGRPVRSVGVNLSGLVDDNTLQQTLFRDTDKLDRLARVVDRVQERFGKTAVLRAASLLPAGQAVDRAGKIGGHLI